MKKDDNKKRVYTSVASAAAVVALAGSAGMSMYKIDQARNKKVEVVDKNGYYITLNITGEDKEIDNSKFVTVDVYDCNVTPKLDANGKETGESIFTPVVDGVKKEDSDFKYDDLITFRYDSLSDENLIYLIEDKANIPGVFEYDVKRHDRDTEKQDVSKEFSFNPNLKNLGYDTFWYGEVDENGDYIAPDFVNDLNDQSRSR